MNIKKMLFRLYQFPIVCVSFALVLLVFHTFIKSSFGNSKILSDVAKRVDLPHITSPDVMRGFG